MMQIHVSTDNHIKGSERLTAEISKGIETTFDRFESQITRVNVHLADVNSHKDSEQDKRCLIEAHVAGHQPMVASHQAATIHDSVDGASEKLFRTIETTLGKLHSQKGLQTSAGGDQQI